MITFCNTFCRQFCRREPETALQLSVSSMAGTFTKTFSFIFAFIHGIPEIRLFSSSRPVPDWLRAYDHNEVMKHKWLAAGQSSRLALGFITHLSVKPKGRQTAKVESAFNDAPEVQVDGNTDTPVEQSAVRPSAWP